MALVPGGKKPGGGKSSGGSLKRFKIQSVGDLKELGIP